MEWMQKNKVTREVARLRHVFGLFSYIFVFWGCYRLILKLPDQVEELILKPVFWLGPTLWLVLFVEKRALASIGWVTKNFFSGIYWGVGLGMLFAIEGLLGNFFKYGQVSFSPLSESTTTAFLGALGISFVTAVSEETVFRGYILSRLDEVFRNGIIAATVTSVLFVLTHLPLVLFVLHYSPSQVFSYFLLLFLFSLGSSWIFLRLRSIIPSIVVHSLWGWAVLLFR